MNQAILERIRSCPGLPSLPSVAVQVVQMTAEEDMDINDLSELITADPALTTKILKTVNSPFYGLSNNVSTISKALIILGLQSVKTLVLGFSLVRNMRSAEDTSFDYATYWRRSIFAAVAARSIGVKVRLVQREEAFLSALLQDVGMPVLHTVLGDEYDRILAGLGPEHHAVSAAETEALGTTHAEVAAFLLGEWKLPPVLSEPVANHHDPESSSVDILPLARVVHLAGLCAEVFMNHVTPAIIQAARDYAQQQFDLDEEKLAPLMAQIAENTQEVAKLFEVSVGEHRDYDEILSQANEQLMRLSLLSQQQATQMQLKAKEFEQQANTDALTQVANRKRFATELHDEFARAVKFARPLAMAVVDADRFKSINDTHGHDVGDAVLVRLARTLREGARSTDLVARYGGEEFVILMPETNVQDAASIAESIRAAVAAEPVLHENLSIPLTISAGVAIAGPGSPFTNERTFFRAADGAVYRAKQNGRNRVEIVVSAEAQVPEARSA
jgi:diguanylate cyclase (GGDEF)-like protein